MENPAPEPTGKPEVSWGAELDELGASAPQTLSDEFAATKQAAAKIAAAWLSTTLAVIPSAAKAIKEVLAGRYVVATLRLALASLRAYIGFKTGQPANEPATSTTTTENHAEPTEDVSQPHDPASTGDGLPGQGDSDRSSR